MAASEPVQGVCKGGNEDQSEDSLHIEEMLRLDREDTLRPRFSPGS